MGGYISPTLRKRLNIMLFTSVFSLIFVFYLWTASSNEKPFVFRFSKEANSYHSYMADAFLHGQLNLRIDPNPKLLALEDPYDPVANEAYRLHDASLYHGKYFLYFTPTVALLFIAPMKLIFGYFISEILLTAIFCFIGVVFSYLILIRILRIGLVQTSLPILLFSALLLAVATTVPFLLRRPAVYELCISAGYCFMMIGTYFLVISMTNRRSRSRWIQIFSAGILIGLCFSSRPSQIPTCGLLIMAFFFVRYYLFREKNLSMMRDALFLLTPVILIGAVMGWYNYARFGSIFEFGISYQLAGVNYHRIDIMAPIYIPLGLYHYIFQTIPFDLRFPFFHVVRPIAPISIPFFYYYEQTIGLLSLPVYWLLIPPLFCLRSIWRISPSFLMIALFIFSGSMLSLVVVSSVVGPTMRYIVDFSPLLLLATLSLFFSVQPMIFSQLGPGPQIRRLSFYIPALFTIFISISISMSGYFDSFRNLNPQLYHKIEHFFHIGLNVIY